MRILYWLSVLLFVVAAFFAVVVYVGVRSTPGSGMAMIYFLPLSCLAWIAGAVTVAIRFLRRQTLSKLEQFLGLGLFGFWVLGSVTLALLIWFD